MYIDPSGEEIGLFGSMLIGAAVAIVSTVVMNAINDIPIWYGLGKATVFGAAAGASSYGIGAAVKAANLDVIVQAAMHGASAGQMSLLSGGDFKTGFISGVVASLVGSGIGSLGPEGAGYLDSGVTKASMIVGGGLSGGISSSIAGGDFGQGMLQGLITSGLNHVAHMVVDEIKERSLVNDALKREGLSPDDASGVTTGAEAKTFMERLFPLLSKLGHNPSYDLVDFDDPNKGGESPRRIMSRIVKGKLVDLKAFGEQKNILLSKSVTAKNFSLAKIGVHELIHRVHLVTGIFRNWAIKYNNDEAAHVLSEIDAYEISGELPKNNKTYQGYLEQAKLNGWER